MELRVLNYFVEIVNQHGITKAANHLHISQSTLSRQIQDLEQELGTQLFIRKPRQLSLTEDGYFLYHRALEILKLSQNTESYLQQGQTLAGELSIGAGENQANDYLLPSFNEYHTLTLPFEDYWGVAFPSGHPFDQKNEIIAADLQEKDLLIPYQLDSSSQLLSYLNEYVVDYRVVGTYDMHYNMRAMINAGLGLALTFNKPIYQSGNIHFRRLQFLHPIQTTLIWRKDHQLTRLGNAFIEEVNKQVRNGGNNQ